MNKKKFIIKNLIKSSILESLNQDKLKFDMAMTF